MKRALILIFPVLLSGCAKYATEFLSIDRSYQYTSKLADAPIDVYTEDIRQDYEVLAKIGA